MLLTHLSETFFSSMYSAISAPGSQVSVTEHLPGAPLLLGLQLRPHLGLKKLLPGIEKPVFSMKQCGKLHYKSNFCNIQRAEFRADLVTSVQERGGTDIPWVVPSGVSLYVISRASASR